MKKYFALPLLFLVLAGGFALAAGKQWLHVRVSSEGAEQFNLNLPLSLVDALLPMVEDRWDSHRSGRFHWRGEDWTIAELRELWEVVKEERGYDLASFSGKRHNQVRLFLDDRYIRVESEDGSREHVSARIPIAVVDALLSGEGEELNLIAAVNALKALGSEELITAEGEEGTVQVWIDESNR